VLRQPLGVESLRALLIINGIMMASILATVKKLTLVNHLKIIVGHTLLILVPVIVRMMRKILGTYLRLMTPSGFRGLAIGLAIRDPTIHHPETIVAGATRLLAVAAGLAQALFAQMAVVIMPLLVADIFCIIAHFHLLSRVA
jgi:hypothetical protein